MKRFGAIKETRTYWTVCAARHDGKWIQHGYLLDSEEEGQRKLRWFRQWYPTAFLVEIVMATVEDNFHAPPLPLRSRSTSQTQPVPAGKPQLYMV